MNYFPSSPIPAWPDPLPDGWTTIDSLIFDLGLNLSAAGAQVRSDLYRNGEPMVCIACGSLTTANGDILCGH